MQSFLLFLSLSHHQAMTMSRLYISLICLAFLSAIGPATVHCTPGLPLFDLEEGSGGSGSGDNFGGGGSGSGDLLGGSGAGSGGDVVPSPSPRLCDVPSTGNGNDTGAAALTMGDVVLKSRCFSACLEKVLNSSDQDSTDTLKYTYFPWKTISQAILRNNCLIYSQVYQCQQGCEYRSLSATSCAEDCMDDCQSSVPSYLPQSACSRQCDESLCVKGCQTYEDLLSFHYMPPQEDPFPVSPNGSLSLHKFSSPYLHKIGAYRLQYNSSAPPDDSDSVVTSFLVQVQRKGYNAVNYWMMSLNDILSLDYSLLCQTVTVRFLPINKYGNSTHFSDPVTLSVYGDIYPRSPDHPATYGVSFAVSDDTFWDHGVVNISWLPPNNHEYADGFSVQINSPSKNCGSSKTLSVSRDQYSVTWRAAQIGDGPFSNCTYSVKILSVPSTSDYPGQPQSIPLQVITSNPFPADNYTYTVQMSATRTASTGSHTVHFFTFNVSWTLPAFPTVLTQDIKHFVLYFWIDEELNAKTKPIKFTNNKLNYSYTFGGIRSRNSGYFLFELQTIYKSASSPYKYITDNSTLRYDARPLAPTMARNVSMRNLSISAAGKISLLMSWREPAEKNGFIEYIVSIGLQPRTGNSDAATASTVYLIKTKNVFQLTHPDSHFRSYDGGHVWELSIANDNFKFHRLPNDVNNWQLYVQVIVKSSIPRTSNWTDPIVFTVHRVQFTVSYTVSSSSLTTTPTLLLQPATTSSVNLLSFSSPATAPFESPGNNDKSTGNNESSLVPIYGIIPVVIVLILAILIASILLLIAYVQNKRLRNTSNHFFNASMKSSLAPNGVAGWEINPSTVEEVELIGEGTFGPVYHGKITKTERGKKVKEVKHVALMSLKVSATDHEYKEFYVKLEQYKEISSIDECGHPSLPSLVGVIATETPSIVTELSYHSDLLTYLQNKKQEVNTDHLYTTIPSFDASGSFSLMDDHISPSDLLDFAKQIASAMDCLSGLGIIHKDLACRNIYLDRHRTLKIASFGIVTNGPREDIYPMELPLRWMALESIIEHSYSTASDVWSYGVTLWEIITLGGFPYKSIDNKDILSHLMSGNRLECPANCSSEFFTILQSCWDTDPNRRPTFELLHETLLNQLTQGDCHQLVRIHAREFQPSPTQLSTDSAICCSPTLTESTTCDQSKAESQPVSDLHLSAVNLTFRKDSLDVPESLRAKGPVHIGRPPAQRQSSPLSVQVTTTNLDTPRVHVVTAGRGTMVTTAPIYDSITPSSEDGSTEV